MGSVETKDDFRRPATFLTLRDRIEVLLTIFREGELKHRRNKEGQSAFRMVDLSTTLAEPACLSLVRYLIEAAILPRHEDSAQVCRCDGQDVGVVCGD